MDTLAELEQQLALQDLELFLEAVDVRRKPAARLEDDRG
jgi:hypothetical protein